MSMLLSLYSKPVMLMERILLSSGVILMAMVSMESECVSCASMRREFFLKSGNGNIDRSDGPEPRLTLDFMLDPSLFVSILHTFEVAYWTLPFGFLLMPILNIFRVPNRRSARLTDFFFARKIDKNNLYSNFLKALDGKNTD